MIIVNNNQYTDRDFNKRAGELFRISRLKKTEGKLAGICLGKPFDFLSLVLYIMKSNGSVLVIHPETPLETAIEASRKAGCSYLIYQNYQDILTVDGSFPFQEPSILQYSSGTTGEPKLIERPWKNVERETDYYNRKSYFDSSETPVILVPLAHSYGFGSGVLSSLKRGSEPVIVTERNPKFMAHIIKKTKKAIVYGTPFFFNLLLSLKDPELRFHKMVSSGAPLPEKLFDRLKSSSDEIFQQYGSTETGCISLGRNPVSSTDTGSPLQYLAVKIDNDKGPGEIIVSFDDKTVHTRDLGYFSGTGSLNIVSRLDDLINVGGQKVIPYEVETVIAKMDDIKEVVVYKTKHPLYGEAVKAMVAGSKDISTAMIKEWCQKYLPPFKIPSAIDIVDEIPKTQGGKISRKLLIEKEYAL